MPRSIFCLLFLLLFSEAGAQVKADTTYHPNENIRQIITKKGNISRIQSFKAGGELESDIYYKEDQYHGTYKEYYRKDKIKVEATYDNGLLTGPYRLYTPEGRIQEKLNYKIFRDENGRHSELDGKVFYYQRDGKLVRKGKFVRGQVEGVWKKYDTHGQLNEVITYANGKKAGKQLRYYPNGNLQSKIYIYEDVRIGDVVYPSIQKGISTYYYENGNKKSEKEYKDGKATGKAKSWREEGWLQTEFKLTDEGKRISRSYDKEGNLTNYSEEKLITHRDGYPRWIKDGLTRSYRDKILITHQYHKDGKTHGPFKFYYPDGTLEREGIARDGSTVGTFKMYHEDGSLKSEQNSVERINWNGSTTLVEHGWHRNYNEEGKIIYEAFNDKSGIKVYQTTYNSDGEVLGRSYNTGEWSASMEFYPDGSLRITQAGNRAYMQVAIFFITGKAHQFSAKSQFDERDNYQVEINGLGELVQATGSKQAVIEDIESYSIDPKASDFYSPEVPDGHYEIEYVNGQPRLNFSIKDKLLDGTLEFFRPDGSLAYFATLEKGLNSGLSYYLTKEGDTLTKNIVYPDGGSYSKTQHANGVLKINKTKRPGLTIYEYETYENGNSKRLTDHENKIFQSWFEDGTLASKSTPVKGNPDRSFNISYFPNGNINRSSYTENGKIEGEYLAYHENGQLMVRNFYENGEQHGLWESYREDGSLRAKGNLVKGKKEGTWLKSSNGIIKEVYYKNDKAQVKIPDGRCACLDTTKTTSWYGYLNSVSLLLEYYQFTNFGFPFIELLDTSQYRSLFYKSKYSSRWDMHSLEIISFVKLIFSLGMEGRNHLVLNACHTPGYLSEIQFNYDLDFSRPEEREFIFYSPKFDLKIASGILQQSNAQDGKITIYMEPEELHFNEKYHLQTHPSEPELCFEDIMLEGWKLNRANAIIIAAQTLNNFFSSGGSSARNLHEFIPHEMMEEMKLITHSNPALYGSAKSSFNKEAAFLNAEITGFFTTNAKGVLRLIEDEVSFSSRYLWITDSWIGGHFEIAFEGFKNERFTFNSINDKKIELSQGQLERVLKNYGLENIEITRFTGQDRIKISFFNPGKS